MPEINVPLDKLNFFMDDIAQRLLPYACAMTLTHVAMDTADDCVKLANLRFNVKHRTYLKNATHAKIGQAPSPARAFHAMPANMDDGMNRMKSTVGVTHWGIADLVDGRMDVRRTRTAKYRWVPLKGRKMGYGVKQAYPGQGKKSKGNFFMKSRKRNYLIVTRAGKSNKLTPIFLRKKEQNMRPIFNISKIAEQRFEKYWDKHFEKDMDYAIKKRGEKWLQKIIYS